jgi:sporulation protein YlmC with PRC-barrel domain
MKLSEVSGLHVTTESGERLGSVHDVRGELTERTLWVTGLVVGKAAVFEHLGLGAPQSGLKIHSHDVIEWKDVVRLDRRGVVVRDGTRPS